MAGGPAVAVWQTLDKAGHRGVVALGQVIGDATPHRDVGNPYWVVPAEGDEEHIRAPVRYITIPSPLWVDGTMQGQFLGSLSVARSQGGTVFHLTADQWNRICELAGAPATEAAIVSDIEGDIRRADRPASGQGFGLDIAARVAVERHAMRLATAYLSSHWDSVVDVSARCSYDLLCRSGHEELRVEVKGTTTLGGQVILTRREVMEANAPGFTLFVVSEIELRNNAGQIAAHGGRCRIIRSWQQDKHTLTPIAYYATIDWSEGEDVAVGGV